jgi:hypothetical protein
MARGIARRMSFAEDEWALAQRVYRAAVNNALAPLGIGASGPMCLNPAAFRNDQSSMASTIANFGFYAAQLARAIRAEGLHADHLPSPGRPRQVASHRIAIDRPAIALVYWDGGGGHFVVVGRATPGQISFLDPWDGHINEQPNNGRYSARYGGRGQIGELIYMHA